MSYLIRRGPTWHFRFRLPSDLRGLEAPARLPEHLRKLVNRKTRHFKQEITESLRTSDNSVARSRAGLLISDSEFLVREMRRFLTEGAPRTLSPEVIAYLAERRVHEMLVNDDKIRAEGLGLDLQPMRDASLAKLTIGGQAGGGSTNAGTAHGDGGGTMGTGDMVGMTPDDLGLLTYAADQAAERLKAGVAFGRTPDWIAKALDTALTERDVRIDRDSAERRELERSFLGATQQAFQAIRARNDGVFTPTPPSPRDPAEKHGPKLSEAFAAWKAGTLLPGSKPPAPRSAAEAEYVVRRFREMHGDIRVGSVTREQARRFVEALWRLPTRLPANIERLKLPDILARSDIGQYPQRASGTLGKHVNLIASVLEKAANAHDLAFGGSGWSNPFKGLRPEVSSAQERGSFAPSDLEAVFGSPIYTAGYRPTGGAGEAAFWLPALGLLTGARLGELCQLRLCDLKRNETTGGLYLDISTSGGRKLKTATSRRRIPLHSAFSDMEFPAYVAQRRREEMSEEALLFPGLAVRSGLGPGFQWSKWFGRWRTEKLKLAGSDERKDFHSFRHTFKDMCREAGIEEEVHDALTGHAGGGVGRRYGTGGVPLAVLTEAVESLKVPEIVAGLRWTAVGLD